MTTNHEIKYICRTQIGGDIYHDPNLNQTMVVYDNRVRVFTNPFPESEYKGNPVLPCAFQDREEVTQ